MNAKKITSVTLASLLLCGLVAVGIYFFLELKEEKKMYQTDLLSLIPEDVESVLSVENEEISPENESRISRLFPDQSAFPWIRPAGDDHLEVLFFCHPSGALLLCKLTEEEFQATKDRLSRDSGAPAQEEKSLYKNIQILSSLIKKDLPFYFVYHQGAFLGSYSKHLLFQSIDRLSQKLPDNDDLRACFDTKDKNKTINLFFKEGHEPVRLMPFQKWLSGNVDIQGDKFGFSGIISQKDPEKAFYYLNSKTVEESFPDTAIIPGQTYSLVRFNSNQLDLNRLLAEKALNFTDSTLIQSLNGPVGLCYFYGQTSRVARHRIVYMQVDKNRFTDNLRKCIIRSGKSENGMIETIPTSGKQALILYKTNQSFGSPSVFANLFRQDPVQVLALYNDYVLFGKNESDIFEFVDQIENHTPGSGNSLLNFMKARLQQYAQEINVFMVSDGNETPPDLFPGNRKSFRGHFLFLYLNNSESGMFFNWEIVPQSVSNPRP